MAEGKSAITDLMTVANGVAIQEMLGEKGNKTAEGLSVISDPSLFIPTMGVMSAGSKSLVSAPVKGVGKAAQFAGQTIEKAAAKSRAAKESVIGKIAPDLTKEEVKILSRGGRLNALVSATGSTVKALGDVTVGIADDLVTPRRAPSFARIIKDPTAPLAAKGVAYVGKAAQPLIDTAGHAAAGALEGAAIGGALGYLSEGEEGFLHGLGGGALLGGVGGSAARTISSLTGGTYRTAVDAEFLNEANFLSENSRSPFMEFGSRLDTHAKAALVDVSNAARRLGQRVEFFDGKGKVDGIESTKFKGIYRGKGGGILINVKEADVTTAPHEFLHFALEETGAKNDISSIRNMVFGFEVNGKRIQDPVFSDESVNLFAERYAESLGLDHPQVAAEFRKLIRDARDSSLKAATRETAQNKVSEELMAYLVGEKFGKQYRDSLNADHIAGYTTRLMGWMSDHVQMLRRSRRERIDLSFSKGLDGAFTAAVKDPRVKKVVDEVFGNIAEPQSSTGKNKINLDKMTAEAKAKMRETIPASRDLFNEDGTAKAAEQVQAEEVARSDAAFRALKEVQEKTGIEILNEDGSTSIMLDKASVEEVSVLAAQYTPSTRQFLNALIDGMRRGSQPTYVMNYFKALGRRGRKRAYTQAELSTREVLPYRVDVNQTGGAYVRAVDMTKVNARLKKFNARDKVFTNAEEMTGYLQDYLTNLTNDAPRPSADVLGGGSLGVKRRNFFHEALGTVPSRETAFANLPREGYIPQNNSIFQSFRLERITALSPTQTSLPFKENTTYRHTQANFQPVSNREGLGSDAIYSDGVHSVRKSALRYARNAKIKGYRPIADKARPSEVFLKQAADLHANARHEPNHPKVKAAYKALADEVVAQYDHMIKDGFTPERFEGDGEPYSSSRELITDVAENNHLWFFATDNGFGSSGIPNNHPLLADSGRKLDGRPLLANDVFRIVHDLYGHSQNGYQFGPVGEFNAYKEHAAMLSDKAQSALAAETLAQNAWVNYGRHMRRKDGSVPKRGDKDYTPPQHRPFAEQKAFVVPKGVRDAATKFQPADVGSAPTRYSDYANFGKKFKTHGKMLEHIGSRMGVKVKGNFDVEGAWVDTETGILSSEAAHRTRLEVDRWEDAELMAAMAGALAPEVQNGVLVTMKHDAGNATELSIKMDSKNQALQLAKRMLESGLHGLTVKGNELIAVSKDESALIDLSRRAEGVGQRNAFYSPNSNGRIFENLLKEDLKILRLRRKMVSANSRGLLSDDYLLRNWKLETHRPLMRAVNSLTDSTQQT